MVSLEGLDGLVFTAGIGENDPSSARPSARAWPGRAGPRRGGQCGKCPRDQQPESRVIVRVIPTDEERQIALHTFSLTQPFMDAAREFPDDASGRSVRQARACRGHCQRTFDCRRLRGCLCPMRGEPCGNLSQRQGQAVCRAGGRKAGRGHAASVRRARAGRTEAVFETIRKEWGRLDFVLHSIAFAPHDDLFGRVVDSSAEGFALAISCHSFVRMAHLAEPLMDKGGALLSVTFYGSERVVAHYNLMGPVKAALESTTRYVAAELGAKGIRAHAISPGPISTRAASGIDRFDELLDRASALAPEGTLATIDDVGALAAFLASDAARHITGTVIPVDGGAHLMA
jgi:enoyl-[acyl-carrier protein] reductase I